MAVFTPEINALTSSNSRLGVEDFLKILLTQLTYQDPLKPLDNQQFMAQIAQFTTLEQTQQVSTKLSSLINTQSALQSVGLLGRTIDINSAQGLQSGQVTALSLSGETPVLTLRTSAGAILNNVSYADIVTVR